MSTNTKTHKLQNMSIDSYLNVMETTQRVEYTKTVEDFHAILQLKRLNSFSKKQIVGMAASFFLLISMNVILMVQKDKAKHPKAAQQLVRVLHLETNNDIYHE